MRSKWTILSERLAEHKAEAARIEDLLDGLNNTDCGLECSGCGEFLRTEGDFARHFAVKRLDEINNCLNLGSCPKVDR